MKIILITLVFLFSCFESYCEWKFIHRQSNGNNIYLNFQSVKFKNGLVYWSELVNFDEQIAGIMSMSVNMVGNCKKFYQRSVKFDYFSKHFGKEFVNSSSNKGKKWVIIDPKSPQYQILKKICKSYKN